MVEIKTFNIFQNFLAYNQYEILSNYYSFYHLLRTLDDLNAKRIKLYDFFNTIDNNNRSIISIRVDSTCYFYSDDWTDEMIQKIRERVPIQRFTNYTFLGQQDLVLQILNSAGVQPYLKRNRIVYTCNKVQPDFKQIVGIVENASMQYVDQCIDMCIKYYQEDFEGKGIRSEKEITLDAIKSIKSRYLYCLRIDDTIHSILKVISYDQRKPLIGNLFTLKSSRNNGFAYKLLSEVSLGLFNENFEECGLLSDADNPASNKIFRKIGYKPIYNLVIAFKK